MSINLYIGKRDLPKDKKFILDVRSAMIACRPSGTTFERLVLSKIEHGTYKDTNFWIDRFGGQLYYSQMSTGSKVLMLLELVQDYIINCDEVGSNTFPLFYYLDDCNIYFSYSSRGIPKFNESVNVIFRGKSYKGGKGIYL